MGQNHPEDIRGFYESVYYREAAPYRSVSGHLRRLVRRLKVQAGESVLDVGCGLGEWLFACRQRGAIPSGIDLSERAIGICRTVMPEGNFYAGSAEMLPFDDNQFDLVSCLGALEHFLDQPGAVREMVRVAKRDARVLLLVPNAGFLTRRLGLYQGTDQRSAREEVHSLDEWAGLFRDCGLEVEARWSDLHVLSWHWIRSRGWKAVPLRATQALALPIWPLDWQYQVYHQCRLR